MQCRLEIGSVETSPLKESTGIMWGLKVLELSASESQQATRTFREKRHSLKLHVLGIGFEGDVVVANGAKM